MKMTEITLPFWLFVVLAGIPVLCLLGLVARGVKNLRKATCSEIEAPLSPTVFPHINGIDFNHDLNALQIDTVFNTLAAMVETERIKLKTLLCPTMNPVSAPLPDSSSAVPEATKPDSDETKGIRQQIAQRAASGESTSVIANALGISCNEVELSLSISDAVVEKRVAQLEAVA